MKRYHELFREILNKEIPLVAIDLSQGPSELQIKGFFESKLEKKIEEWKKEGHVSDQIIRSISYQYIGPSQIAGLPLVYRAFAELLLENNFTMRNGQWNYFSATN